MSVGILTLSSKGQIVLPVEIRRNLDLKDGSRLAIYSSDDAILLKPISLPTESDFSKLLDKAQKWAQSVGYEESDVDAIIRQTRKRARKK